MAYYMQYAMLWLTEAYVEPSRYSVADLFTTIGSGF